MTLNPYDEHRLAELVQAQRARGLLPHEEAELRRLLRTQNPQAENMSIGDLVGLALMVLGAGALFGWLLSKSD